MYRLNRKRLHLRKETFYVLVLILMATLLRLILIYFNWPTTNSDEGNMGIVARHVAYNGEWPIFFYGNLYLGPLEGYLAAPLFHLFGSSTFVLRLGLLPCFPLFLICMYYLTRLLYTQKLAVFTVILLCFGSQDIISRQLKAVGEYPELLFFAAFISFAISWLVLSYHRVGEQARTTVMRIFLYGVLGFVIGIALWVDFLILPFLGTGITLLLLVCRRELRSRAGIGLLLGFVVGAFPLLYYNFTAPLQKNSIAILLNIHHTNAHLQLLSQMIGTLMVSLPNATGFNPLCPPQAFPSLGVPNVQCVVLQGSWGLGYLILWGLAMFFVACTIWQGWRGKSLFKPTWNLVERQSMVRQCCRLMLLVSAGGTILLYATSPIAALLPDVTSRYLVCLLVATPATLWPLWKGIGIDRKVYREPQPADASIDNELGVSTFSPDKSDPMPSALASERVTTRFSAFVFLRGSLLLLILIMFVVGTFRTFFDIPHAQKFYQQQDQLVQKLLSLDATRIYSEYWTCNRLTFQSSEQIICSSLNPNLSFGYDRYLPYRSIVKAAPHPTFVFPQEMQQVKILDAILHKNGQFRNTYQRQVFEGYVIYFPKTRR